MSLMSPPIPKRQGIAQVGTWHSDLAGGAGGNRGFNRPKTPFMETGLASPVEAGGQRVDHR